MWDETDQLTINEPGQAATTVAPLVTAGQLQNAEGRVTPIEVEPVAESELPVRGGSRRPAFPYDEDTVSDLFHRLRGPTEELRDGDRSAVRDRLVLAHTPLVEHCARAFVATGEPVEDLVQEGFIGLIKAVDRFDPATGTRFSTYACHLIAGAMRHYLRDLGKLIHEPGWHAQLRSRIVRTSEELTQKLARPPAIEELAATLDLQPQVVRAVLQTHQVLAVESLDTPYGDDDSPGYQEGTGQTDSCAAQVENHLLLDANMPRLRDLEQRAIRLFYYQEHNKTEIARELGISVNYASYLLKRGLEHLRRNIAADDTLRIVEAAASSSTVLSPLALPEWLERLASKHTDYAVLLFTIRNWAAATARLNEGQRATAEKAAAALTRRCCRLTDKVTAFDAGIEGALCFVAFLPKTDHRARRLGERWADRCTSSGVYPLNPAAVDALLCDYSLALSSEANIPDALLNPQ